MAPANVFVFAGEASADALGAMVIDGLSGAAECWGVGGPAMAKRGFRSVRPMEDFTVIGLRQAIGSLSRLSRLGDELIDAVLDRRPDAILTIDNKGFSMRFARRLRKRMAATGWRAPILHLVAPQVWAWAGWRAREVARSVDHLLCLFPFEAPYFEGRGLKVTVTGHPAAEKKQPSRGAARKRFGLGKDVRALVLLPGSRPSEIRALLPDMLEAARIALASTGACTGVGRLAVLVPAADSVRDEVERAAEAAGIEGLRVCAGGDLAWALAAGDYGLICSGTVTLETALAGLPGSVYYRPDWITRSLGAWMVDRGKVVLANAVSGEEIYPLHLGGEFTARTMAETAASGLAGAGRLDRNRLAASLGMPGGFAACVAGAVMSEIEGSGGGRAA